MTESSGSAPIIVGFDGSERAHDALALGRALARLTGSRLVVANVYAFDMPFKAEAIPSDLDAVLEARSMDVLEEVGDELEGVNQWERSAVVATSPARGLHELAHRTGARLIVIGSGHRHHPGNVRAPTALRLIHGAPCAIAIASRGWRDRRDEPLRTVGAAFDDTEPSHAALSLAAAIARQAGATLQALTAFEPPHPAHPVFAVSTQGYGDMVAGIRREFERRAADAVASIEEGLTVKTRVLDGPAVDMLAEESGSLDLLVVGSRRYGPVRTVLLGSVSAGLVDQASCSVVVVPRGVAPLPGGAGSAP